MASTFIGRRKTGTVTARPGSRPLPRQLRLQQAHDIAVNANETLARLNAPSAGFFDQMLPTLDEILAMLPE